MTIFTQYQYPMKNKIPPFFIGLSLLLSGACTSVATMEVDKQLDYCEAQASRTLRVVPVSDSIPNYIDKDDASWHFTTPGSWTSGFWPGILWYMYEYTRDESWMEAARQATATLIPMTSQPAHSHDSGFITMCSLGNGYRLTGAPEYKDALLNAANHLAELYNPTVGTILSWPGMVARENWPHNTIIDNMMNLELLLWAAKNGGEKRLYDIAVKHAETTMEHGFRPDGSTYHVAVYDTITGNFIKGVTHQGLSDESLWARGQTWAIYGYTMMYRETGDIKFLDFARKVADVYLSRLPEDLVPYWDFKALELGSNEPRDASAAAIAASGLLELSTYISDASQAAVYRNKAEQMLQVLSSEKYQSRNHNTAFLLHSVGHMPRRKEVDASIIYADYYYMEALIRLKRLQ